MVRRILALGAAGALVLMMLPSVTSAAQQTCGPSEGQSCGTAVTFDVSLGTTIISPATIDMGFGFPGQVVSTATGDGPYTVGWWSNETGKSLQVKLTDLVCTDQTGSCLTANAGPLQTIDNEDVDYIVTTKGDGSLDLGTYSFSSERTVQASLAPNDKEVVSTEGFNLQVHVPSVVDGTYEGTMTFEVK